MKRGKTWLVSTSLFLPVAADRDGAFLASAARLYFYLASFLGL
jgi:hypothetical protein